MGRWRPFIVGIGGTMRSQSSTESALRLVLAAAERLGADVTALTARDLELPPYTMGSAGGDPRATSLIELVARSDGLVVASPGFHGGMSGLIKNAIDYLEELRTDPRPYLDGRAVGCVACAAGWQATTTTLVNLRSSIHALRGWPTPLGVTINSADTSGVEVAQPQLALLAQQVVEFARARHAMSVCELRDVDARHEVLR